MKEKQGRIKEITAELRRLKVGGEEEGGVGLGLGPEEEPEKVLEVREEEIHAPKFVSKEEKERRARLQVAMRIMIIMPMTTMPMMILMTTPTATTMVLMTTLLIVLRMLVLMVVMVGTMLVLVQVTLVVGVMLVLLLLLRLLIPRLCLLL